MRSTLKHRSAVVAATFIVALGLVACGGGGGGGDSIATAPAPNPVGDTTPPALTLATALPASLTTTVVVTANEDLGGIFSVTVKNGTATVAGSQTLQPGNRGVTWTPTSALACNTVYTVTASANDLANNTGTSTFTVTTVGCPATALRYTDKVVAIWTDALPFMVTKSGVTKVTNLSGDEVLNCSLANKALSDGRVLIECVLYGVTPMTLKKYAIDPVAGTFTGFVGTVPSDITFTLYDESSTQPVAGTTAARVADGWYYAEPGAPWRLLFQPDAGGTPAIVKDGTFAVEGSIRVICAYNN